MGLEAAEVVGLLWRPVATVRVATSKLRKFVQNLKYQTYAEKSPVSDDLNLTPENTFQKQDMVASMAISPTKPRRVCTLSQSSSSHVDMRFLDMANSE